MNKSDNSFIIVSSTKYLKGEINNYYIVSSFIDVHIQYFFEYKLSFQQSPNMNGRTTSE